MQKRNTAVDLTDLAIGIVVLGIVVAIGANILIKLRDSTLTDLTVSTTNNETTTALNESGTTLDNPWVAGITRVTNSTTTHDIVAANYSLSVDSVSGVGTISYSDTSAGWPNDTAWNVTYTTYNTSEPQWALANNAALGLAEYGNWFDIIVIVGIAGLILSLIFLAFGNRGQETGVSY